MGDEKKEPILEFVDALRRREWWVLRRLLLGLLVPAGFLLFQNRSILGNYAVPAWTGLSVLFFVLILSEIFARPRASFEPGKVTHTHTIRGLVAFGEDDAALFAQLGRATDISKVVNALLDPQFRFGVLYAESGCGKTSLLRADVMPELKKRG